MKEIDGLQFDDVAELYDTVRNHYPEQLFRDLFTMTQLKEQDNVLEIGSGTGIATRPIAKLGCNITGIEPGENMLKIARKNLQNNPNVVFINERFEDWEGKENQFDLVIVATAFHWLDPHSRYERIASLLKEDGYLAIINYKHVTDSTDTFFHEVQTCYNKYMPKKQSKKTPENTIDTIHMPALFTEPMIRKYITVEEYDSERYIQLLTTYSDHLALEKSVQKQLFHCIQTMIHTNYGGFVTKKYENELILLRKK